MKSIKLLACLVTLQFTSSLTLKAADLQDLRQWTDGSGRTIMARLVEVPDAASIKIARADGRVFTVALTLFSAGDQAYVRAYVAAKNPDKAADGAAAAGLKEPEEVTWVLLRAGGTQPGASYGKTALAGILDGVNGRLAAKGVKTAAGLPLKVRTEPADLAGRVQLTGEMPDLDVAAFLKQVAQVNELAIRIDAAGMVVLVDPAAAAPGAPGEPGKVNFFGVTAMP